jgi:iron complex outermembrane receptor protein
MKYISILWVLLLLCSSNLSSQSLGVQGTLIESDSGNPIIGANVFTSSAGTVTDVNGFFRISVDRGDSLTLSYVSYETLVLGYRELSEMDMPIALSLSISENILSTATITGSKYEKRLSESTVSVDVIKPRLIRNTNTVEVDQVLEKVPGVQMIDGQANIRGGSGYSYGAGSRVMLLIDDVPALQSDAGFPNWGDIPVENISQIEVLKGAASALYGSSALNGIINIRRKEVGVKPETEVSLGYTTFSDPDDLTKKWWDESRYGLNASIVHRRRIKEKLDISASLFYGKLESFNDETFQDRQRATLNLKYKISPRMYAGINSIFNFSESSDFFVWLNDSDGAYRPYPGNVSVKNNDRFMIDPYLIYYGDDNTRHKLQLRYFDINNDNGLNQSNFSQMYLSEYQFQKKLVNLDANITAGGLIATTDTEAELFGDTTFNNLNSALYLQVDKKFLKKLSVGLGARYEYNRHKSPTSFMGVNIPDGKSSDGEMVFRAGVNYEFNPYSSVRASWGQGYRFPTITERFIRTEFSGFGIFPNVNLKPEKGWSSEIGVKQGIKLLGYEGFLDISGFWSEYEDMMEFTLVLVGNQVGFQSQNIGNTVIKGIEFSTFGRAFVGDIPINIYGGYTYVDPKYKEFEGVVKIGSSSDENILKYRNRHNFKVDVEADLTSLTFGFSAQRVSNMVAIDAALGLLDGANITEYRAANDNGYALFDVRVGFVISDLKISLLANNIFNEEYTLRPALLEAPRNYSIRLDYDL